MTTPQPVPRRPAAHARERRGLAGGTPASPPTSRRTRQRAPWSLVPLVYTLGTLNPPGLHTWYTQPPWSTHLVHSTPLVYTLGTLNPPGLHTWYTQPPWSTHLVHSTPLVYTLGTLNPPGLHTWYTQPPLSYVSFLESVRFKIPLDSVFYLFIRYLCNVF